MLKLKPNVKIEWAKLLIILSWYTDEYLRLKISVELKDKVETIDKVFNTLMNKKSIFL